VIKFSFNFGCGASFYFMLSGRNNRFRLDIKKNCEGGEALAQVA